MSASARRHLDWKFSIYGPHLHFIVERQKKMNASARRHLDWKFSIYGAHGDCNLFITTEDECKSKEAS